MLSRSIPMEFPFSPSGTTPSWAVLIRTPCWLKNMSCLTQTVAPGVSLLPMTTLFGTPIMPAVAWAVFDPKTGKR